MGGISNSRKANQKGRIRRELNSSTFRRIGRVLREIWRNRFIFISDILGLTDVLGLADVLGLTGVQTNFAGKGLGFKRVDFFVIGDVCGLEGFTDNIIFHNTNIFHNNINIMVSQ